MNGRRLAVVLVSGVLLVVATVGLVAQPTEPVERVPVIIVFEDEPDASLVRRHGGVIKCVYHLEPGLAAWLPPEAIDALGRNPKIAYVVEDLEVFLVQQTTPWGASRMVPAV